MADHSVADGVCGVRPFQPGRNHRRRRRVVHPEVRDQRIQHGMGLHGPVDCLHAGNAARGLVDRPHRVGTGPGNFRCHDGCLRDADRCGRLVHRITIHPVDLPAGCSQPGRTVQRSTTSGCCTRCLGRNDSQPPGHGKRHGHGRSRNRHFLLLSRFRLVDGHVGLAMGVHRRWLGTGRLRPAVVADRSPPAAPATDPNRTACPITRNPQRSNCLVNARRHNAVAVDVQLCRLRLLPVPVLLLDELLLHESARGVQ